MTFPCPNHIECPGSDSPLANLSCEGAEPDGPTYIGRYSPTQQDSDPLPNHFDSDSCLGVCTSQISQAEADQCAEQATMTCLGDGATDPTNQNPDPGDSEPRTQFCNDGGSVQVACPDGTLFSYPVQACQVFSFSKEQANKIAISQARIQANARKVCLSSITSECCIGVSYSSNLTATGNHTGSVFNYWAVTSGVLPTGLSLETQGYGGATNRITGTPTVAGNFDFSIRFTDPVGAYMEKNFTICVLDITSDPAGSDATHLPDANFAEDYTVTLEAPACATAPLSWQIVDGELPIGLTLDEETGIISGTCVDDPDDYTFTVRLQTAAS